MRMRPAREEDADAIARFIIMAEGDMVEFFTGAREPERAVPVMASYVASPVPCRYSLAFTLVAEAGDAGGSVVGAAIAFPADRQAELDAVIVAAVNRRGYALKRFFQEGEPGTYYLYAMGVDPAHRRKGVGTALMRASENEGKRQGFARTSLLLEWNKKRTRRMYERMGYQVATDVEIGGIAYHRMTRTL